MQSLLRYTTLLVFLMTSTCATYTSATQPTAGEVLPQFSLSVPQDPAHQSYLGLTGNDTFTIPQINADILIIEIFSMY